jgi:hypothetical protein
VIKAFLEQVGYKAILVGLGFDKPMFEQAFEN